MAIVEANDLRDGCDALDVPDLLHRQLPTIDECSRNLLHGNTESPKDEVTRRNHARPARTLVLDHDRQQRERECHEGHTRTAQRTRKGTAGDEKPCGCTVLLQ